MTVAGVFCIFPLFLFGGAPLDEAVMWVATCLPIICGGIGLVVSGVMLMRRRLWAARLGVVLSFLYLLAVAVGLALLVLTKSEFPYIIGAGILQALLVYLFLQFVLAARLIGNMRFVPPSGYGFEPIFPAGATQSLGYASPSVHQHDQRTRKDCCDGC